MKTIPKKVTFIFVLVLVLVCISPVLAADIYADDFSHVVVGDGTDGTGSPVGQSGSNGDALSLGRNGVVEV